MLMDLEKIATSAVSESISMTDTMSAFINDGDKEPVWDGHIYIFADNSKKIENIKKVPVQIKGKSSRKLDEEVVKYPLRLSYLNDYLDDGGVLFFVVYISPSGDRKQIYYTSLLPVKLRILLSDIKDGQKTKNIELRKFPSDSRKKTIILLNFYENMQKQTSFRHANLFSQEELFQQGRLESVSFTVTNYGKRPHDIRDLIFEVDDLYMYANIKGATIPQPLQEMPIAVHVFEDVCRDICVMGTKYYGQFRRIKSKDQLELLIGKSVHIRIIEKEKLLKIDFKPTTILEDALVDVPFILAIVKNHQIEIGNVPINLKGITDLYTQERVKTLEYNLEYYQRLEKLFDVLHLDKNRDIASFNHEDNKNSARLFDALLEGKEVSGLKKDIPYVALIDYADTKLALVFKPTEKAGTYKIADFFADNTYELFRIGEHGEHLPTSKYVNLTAENFLELGNVDYTAIIDSFRCYLDEPYCIEEATLLLLQMIHAYDRSQDKRIDILAHAEEMAKWLIETENDYGDLTVMKLNYLQIQKRKRDFTEDEERELIKIAEESKSGIENQDIFLKLGANLLLDNQRSAEFYYKKLDEDGKKQFRMYPIWRFRKFPANQDDVEISNPIDK